MRLSISLTCLVLLFFAAKAKAQDCTESEIEISFTIDSLACNKFEGQIFTSTTSDSIDSYFWIGPDSFFSFDPSPEVKLPGPYQLIVTNINGCIFRDTIQIEYAKPAENFDLNFLVLSCGEPDGILSVQEGPENYSYEWQRFNDAIFSAPESSSITVNQPGAYYVTITNPDNNCEVREWTFVQMDTFPPSISYDPVYFACDSVNINSNAHFFQLESFNWAGPGINATNQDDLFPNVETEGWYNLSGLGSNGCAFSDSLFIEFEETLAYLDSDGDGYGDIDNIVVVNCLNLEGYSSISGDCDDLNPDVNPDAEDMDANGTDENCDGVDGPSTIRTIEEKQINIYPNPVVDQLFIKTDLENLNFAIYTLQGRKLKSELDVESLQFGDLHNGIYLLQITEENSGDQIMKRIVKSSH